MNEIYRLGFSQYPLVYSTTFSPCGEREHTPFSRSQDSIMKFSRSGYLSDRDGRRLSRINYDNHIVGLDGLVQRPTWSIPESVSQRDIVKTSGAVPVIVEPVIVDTWLSPGSSGKAQYELTTKYGPRSREVNRRTGRNERMLELLSSLPIKEPTSDFERIDLIGRGAFGEVHTVRQRDSGKVYALKTLPSVKLAPKVHMTQLRAEWDILARLDSPWVVKLHAAFQHEENLYMVLEFLPGGDLLQMLIRYQVFSEDVTRFYVGEISSGIAEIHEHGFIHRDIKPDNILLDGNGHVKLIDFGLSFEGRDSKENLLDEFGSSATVKTYSVVGTPDYMAPEILQRQGHSYQCDWWSLGVLMYECLVGRPPFHEKDPMLTCSNVIKWETTLEFPEELQEISIAVDLIRKLLCAVESRIRGLEEIKAHAFFEGVDFDVLRQVEAPFRPMLEHDFCYQNL